MQTFKSGLNSKNVQDWFHVAILRGGEKAILKTHGLIKNINVYTTQASLVNNP